MAYKPINILLVKFGKSLDIDVDIVKPTLYKRQNQSIYQATLEWQRIILSNKCFYKKNTTFYFIATIWTQI